MKKWEVHNSKFGQCGTMICGACGEKITGDYLVYQKILKYDDWMFVTHHRKCSSFFDWGGEDTRRRNELNSIQDKIREYEKIYKKLKDDGYMASGEIGYIIEDLEKRFETLSSAWFPEDS